MIRESFFKFSFVIGRNGWRDERVKSSPYVFTKPGGGIYTKNDKPIKEMMNKLCKKAGVKKFGFHAIRHHVAMILEDSGKAIPREIQKMFRHKYFLNNLVRAGCEFMQT